MAGHLAPCRTHVAAALLLLLQRVDGPVEVRTELPGGRQLQVTWHAHTIPQVCEGWCNVAAVVARRAAARRGSQRLRRRLLGLHSQQQRVRHVSQCCRWMWVVRQCARSGCGRRYHRQGFKCKSCSEQPPLRRPAAGGQSC